MSAGASLTATDETLSMTNDLRSSTSSYLRSHKDNPVAWQQWNPSSLELAKKAHRLIFLSIGYSACHWCHVMERESFSSLEVAKALNQNFIPIKVDREVRPDIDEIYMNYVTATTGAGGWPLNLFLTPDLEPVFGGTYWPGPERSSLPRLAGGSDGKLTFLDILSKMTDVWSTQQPRCIKSAKEVTQQLGEFLAEGSRSHSTAPASGPEEPEPLDIDVVDDAFDHFMSRYDPVHGGFSSSSSAPKFPIPPNLKFLLRVGASVKSTSTRFGFPDPIPSILGQEACGLAASMTFHTLLAMSRAGIRDQLGNGFHRYSVTSDWNLPHFEKMLYDNAQLLCCYCDAWALSYDPEILGTIYSLVDYFTSADSRIAHAEGGFFASEDADSLPSASFNKSEKQEGAFYVWTLKQLEAVVGSERDGRILARHYGITAGGSVPYQNDPHDEFVGQNVLHVAATPSALAQEFGLPEAETVKIIKEGRRKLKEARESSRDQPAVDDKIITGWNGLAVAALCHASATLRDVDTVRSEECLRVALKTARFVRRHMSGDPSRALKRHYSPRLTEGDAGTAAYLDDYAYMTQACLALYDITLQEEWLEWASRLQDYVSDHFSSPSGGFSLISTTSPTSTDPEERLVGGNDLPIANLKPGSDNALPSPNGIIAFSLLLLSSYLGDASYKTAAKKTIDSFSIEIIQHPFLFVSVLDAMVLEAVGVKGIVSTGDAEVHHLSGFDRTVVKLEEKDDLPWLRQRNQLIGEVAFREDGKNCVMICEAGGCREIEAGEFDV